MDHMDLISRNSDDGSMNLAGPIILASKTSQKDNPDLGEALKADDCEDFMKSMEKEIKYLTTEYAWEILPKSSLPTSTQIIRLIWSFKRKRNPFGDIIKHKSLLCVHGGMQREVVDCRNTFAPVVNWYTVTLIIMMAEVAGWEPIQIYYVIDLSQVPIDSDFYPCLPAGFHADSEDKNEIYFIQLKNNIYGTRQTAENCLIC